MESPLRALAGALALAVSLAPAAAAPDGFRVLGEVDGAGWWAAGLDLSAGSLTVEVHAEGVLEDPDRGALLASLLDVNGTSVGEWTLVGAEQALAGSVSASALEPVRVEGPSVGGSGFHVVVDALLLFPVPPGVYTFVLAGAAEHDAIYLSASLVSEAGEAISLGSGREAFVFGESAFQCGVGASASAPAVAPPAAGAARATAMSACHRQVQVHDSLFTAFRVRAGGTSATPAFSLIDPLGGEFAPQGASVRVFGGMRGVWDYRLDSAIGAGAGESTPDVAVLVADVAMPLLRS